MSCLAKDGPLSRLPQDGVKSFVGREAVQWPRQQAVFGLRGGSNVAEVGPSCLPHSFAPQTPSPVHG